MKSRRLSKTFYIFLFINITFIVEHLWPQTTTAIIQPGNKTLKYVNQINQPLIDIRVKDHAVPVNGAYAVEITGKAPTRATVTGYSATTIIADASTWNELTGLSGVEMIFDSDASLSIGDQVLVSVENGPEGKDNSISLRLPVYTNQEPYRVYQSGELWCYYNYDGGHSRSLIYFDLVNLSPMATVQTAKIHLYYNDQWYRNNNPPNAGVQLFRILKSWQEGTDNGINNTTINGVTGYERWYADNVFTGNPEDWSAIGLGAGVDYDETSPSSVVLFSEIGPANTPGFVPNKFVNFDVTHMVEGWLDGSYENHGVLLKGNAIADNAVYGIHAGYHQYCRHAEYMGNTTHRPKLVVSYFLDAEPPEILVTLTPDTLWPPNHKMVQITAAVSVLDNSDPTPEWQLLSIESNEPEHGPGKKHFPDILDAEIGSQVTAFELRAERIYESDRIYTITYQATDLFGNTSESKDTVVVPYNLGKDNFLSSSAIPKNFSLSDNYPNPFNPLTTIQYAVPTPAHVRIAVYNTKGQLVKTLVDENRSAGNYSVQFSADRMASGLYFYTIETEKYYQIKKMILVK